MESKSGWNPVGILWNHVFQRYKAYSDRAGKRPAKSVRPHLCTTPFAQRFYYPVDLELLTLPEFRGCQGLQGSRIALLQGHVVDRARCPVLSFFGFLHLRVWVPFVQCPTPRKQRNEHLLEEGGPRAGVFAYPPPILIIASIFSGIKNPLPLLHS